MRYILVTYPDSYDCGIEMFERLEDALERYKETMAYGANPILTKEMSVELVVKLPLDKKG